MVKKNNGNKNNRELSHANKTGAFNGDDPGCPVELTADGFRLVV